MADLTASEKDVLCEVVLNNKACPNLEQAPATTTEQRPPGQQGCQRYQLPVIVRCGILLPYKDRGLTLRPQMFFLSTNECNDYRLEGRLVGHKDAINCLAVSRSGTMLASGGKLYI
jgi:hypothetical protein